MTSYFCSNPASRSSIRLTSAATSGISGCEVSRMLSRSARNAANSARFAICSYVIWIGAAASQMFSTISRGTLISSATRCLLNWIFGVADT